ncbi:MAG: DNA replication and repair protein RecF [Patescibacteria group bacterium]
MISSIRLQHLRSYSDESFEFEEGVNIIVGPNGSGKTNLLEAILVISSGGSYRARDLELIQFGKTLPTGRQAWARLDGQFEKHTRVLKLVLQGVALQKIFELDDKPFKRLSLERTVPVVLFEPNHLQLVTRGPSRRRDYFDDILQRTMPGFKSLDGRYRRTLAQRNSLLKQNRTRAAGQLFAWDVRLSQLGAQIVEARLRLIENINGSIPKVYSAIAGQKSKVELAYQTPISTANYSSQLLSKLEANAEADFTRGFTAYGPHREDIAIYLNGQPAVATASRGEMRSLLLALKIFELKLLESVRDQKPIFLLDDVFSELDGARRKHLVEHLKGYQTIITTTDAEAVLEYFATGKHKLIALAAGRTVNGKRL